MTVAQLALATRRKTITSWPLLLLTMATFVLYSTYAISRQSTYLTAGYDLGIFDQAVRDYAHFRAPIVPLKGQNYNIFADHFHPIIATAAPLYWIWDNPSVLLLLQAGLVSASIPIVHAFAARRMSERAALVIAAAYGFGWPLQAMLDFDFHEIAFGIPILAAAIDALDRKDDRTLFVTAGLLILVREDMGAVLVILGLLRLLHRPRHTGYFLIGIGVGAYLIVTSFLIPAFAANGQFSYWTFDALGADVPHALINIFIHPLHTIRLFFTPWVKTQTLLYLFVPLALLPLRSRYCIIAIPLLAERFFNSRDHLWTTHFHYSALTWLILVLAMVDGGARLKVWSTPRLKVVALWYLLLAPLFIVVSDRVTPQVFRRVLDGSAWQVKDHLRSQRLAVKQIPRNVCVAVDDRLAPQLTNRNRVSLPGIATPKTDYVILDMSQREVGYTLGPPSEALAAALNSGFSRVFTSGTLVVLRSPLYAGASSECNP